MSAVVFTETLRRHLENGAFFTALGLVAALAAISGAAGLPQFWMGLVKLAAVLLGCQLIGPEFSSGTLQLVLAKPVNRSVYLMSRYAGVIAVIWIFVAVPLLFDLLGRTFLRHQPFHAESFAGSANVAIGFTLLVALLAFFGAFTRSYMNVAVYLLAEAVLFALASGLDMIAQGGFPIARFVRDHRWIVRGVETLGRNLYPDAPQRFDGRWTLMVVTNAAIVLLLACLVFRRREVPYGAD